MTHTNNLTGWGVVSSDLVIRCADRIIDEIRQRQEELNLEYEAKSLKDAEDKAREIAEARSLKGRFGKSVHDPNLTDDELWFKLHPFFNHEWTFYFGYRSEDLKQLEGLKSLAFGCEAVTLTPDGARLLEISRLNPSPEREAS